MSGRYGRRGWNFWNRDIMLMIHGLTLILLVSSSSGQKKRKPISTSLQAKWSQTPFVLEVQIHDLGSDDDFKIKSVEENL